MAKIFMFSGVVCLAFITILSIMSSALLARLSRIRQERGIPSWDTVQLVDFKTSKGCSVEALLQDLRLSLRGFLITGIILFVVLFALRKTYTLGTFDRILVYAGFFFCLIFAFFSIRLNIRSASLLIPNVINRRNG
jgi:hypothetical protein